MRKPRYKKAKPTLNFAIISADAQEALKQVSTFGESYSETILRLVNEKNK